LCLTEAIPPRPSRRHVERVGYRLKDVTRLGALFERETAKFGVPTEKRAVPLIVSQ